MAVCISALPEHSQVKELWGGMRVHPQLDKLRHSGLVKTANEAQREVWSSSESEPETLHEAAEQNLNCSSPRDQCGGQHAELLHSNHSDAGPVKARSRSRSKAPVEPEPKRGAHGPRVLRQSGRRLRDSDLARLSREGQDGQYDEIDFSRNELTSQSVSDIVEICRKSEDLKILKLFNNRLGDDGAEELGEIFRHCTSIEEVHLSHNEFTRKGVESLVRSADRGLPRDVKRPLWLRMEHNKLSDTERFARDLERDCPAVCGREDRHRCTPRVCARGRRIHLPFLIEAPKGRGRGHQESWGQRRGRRDSRRRARAPPPPRRNRSESKDSRSRSVRKRAPARHHEAGRLCLRSAPRDGRRKRQASSSPRALLTPRSRRRQVLHSPSPRQTVRRPDHRYGEPRPRRAATNPKTSELPRVRGLNGWQDRNAQSGREMTRTFRQPLPDARCARDVPDNDAEYSYYSYYTEYEDEGCCNP